MNKLAGGNKGVVNGLYVAFYYSGGAVGSSVPGFIYHGCGWASFLSALAAVALSGGLLIASCRGLVKPEFAETGQKIEDF